ncbi:MAG: hypothetical protein IKE00_03565 [Oscillospiraceae bacterium]|nr:hypothetical protein [Oscillospiraceae bacterium]
MFTRLKEMLSNIRKRGKSRLSDASEATERDRLYGKYDHNRDEAMRANVGNTYTRHPGGGPK